MKSFPFLFLFVVLFSASILQAADLKGPSTIVTSQDGSKLFIAFLDSAEVGIFSVAENQISGTIPVAKEPNGLILSHDGKVLYATCGDARGIVQAIDLESNKVVKEVPAGHTPSGGAVTPDGKWLFVCNRFSNDVSQYELPEMKLARRIPVIREPRGAVSMKDSSNIFVINFLPDDPNNIPENPDAMIDVASEVTSINVATGATKNIRLPNGSSSLHGICISPDGRYIYLTAVLARFQIPTTQVERGWINTNGIGIIDTTQIDNLRGGFVNTVLLDDVDLGAANPWGITTSADGKQIYIAISGTDEMMIVDAEAMHKKLETVPTGDVPVRGVEWGGQYGSSASNLGADVPNDLAFLVGMKKRVRLTGKGARPIAAVGNNVYVGMYYNDVLQKVD
ncbi:MAG: cytochrome D1 domain-containing protein, partial [Thermoguttaceae bacterium]